MRDRGDIIGDLPVWKQRYGDEYHEEPSEAQQQVQILTEVLLDVRDAICNLEKRIVRLAEKIEALDAE